ncbi:MAG: hypothetical protein IPK99_11000 [Flavobacteriales bacterium]|nr:hypothetical protein [Flavobacteriales bacterium]
MEREIRYQTLGSPRTQEFVVQWSGMKPFGTTLTTGQRLELNFQIRLNEVDNSIEIVYGLHPIAMTTLPRSTKLACADRTPRSPRT